MAQALYQIATFFADSGKHFIIAFSAGALLFSVMSITSGLLLEYMVWRGATKTSQFRVAAGMAIISLLVAVSVSLLSHVALDYWRMWYTQPLGPALTIR
jgi:hypothetical protein